ncbi:MAG: 2'-5' RNA ligase family protein [Thermoanaerobaculia bacterium]
MSGPPTPAAEPRVFRRQLTLFLSGRWAAEVEAVRRVVDPVQYRLIPAHVTLCREDEIGGIAVEELEARLAAGQARKLTLEFGRAEIFDGHGIRLKCVAGGTDFQALRHLALGTNIVARSRPHITLAHPRNPRAEGNSLAAADILPERWPTKFSWLHLIEQEGAQPWRRLAMFDLAE